MDESFWVLIGLVSGLYGLFGVLLLGLRAIGRLAGSVPQMIQGLATRFLWVETEEEGEKGEKKVVRKPSPQFLGMIEAVAPVLIAGGLSYFKNHPIKLPGGPGGEVNIMDSSGNLNLGALAGVLPKGLQKFAPLLPLLSKFLGSTPGGGSVGKGLSSGNPFLEHR